MKLNSTTYRPEIDGLRAVAVIAVIINHFNKYLIPGGYHGVDIFFVISGYVITSSLAKRQSENISTFFIGFYERRIKRILPALIFFIVIGSLLISLANEKPSTSISTGLFSLIGLSNFHLIYSGTDYFAESSDLNMFTHTWSLSVEEQFYFVYPIIVWFSGFGRKTQDGAKNLLFIMLILFCLSFITLFYFYQINQEYQDHIYYLMPFRFWEIASGCILFIISKKDYFHFKKFNNITNFFIFVLLIGTLFIPSKFFIFSTINVIILTNLLIFSIKENHFVFKLLTNDKVLFIGYISYSLYLWHWGILCFSRWIFGIFWWTIPFQLGLIFFLAYFSFRFIEEPFRRNFYFKLSQSKVLISSFTSISITIFSIFNLKQFLSKNNILHLPSLIGIENLDNNWSEIKCFGNKNLKKINVPNFYDFCLKSQRNNNNDRRFYLIGDSHAAQLYFMFDKVLKGSSYQLAFINNDLKNDFPISFFNKSKDTKYSKTIKSIFDNSRSGDIVAISFHRGFLNTHKHKHVDGKIYKTKSEEEFYLIKNNFINLIKKLQKRGIKVLLIRDIPMLGKGISLEVCEIYYKLFGYDHCEISKEQDDITRAGQDKLFDQLRDNFKNVFTWDPREKMINDNNFSFKLKNKRIMRDNNHITKEFSLSLSKEFEKYLNQLIY